MVWTQENDNDHRQTIQRIIESLHKGGFGKHDKGRYTHQVP